MTDGLARVGVLGAGGMLGSDLVAVLREIGHPVAAATRAQVDLTDRDAVHRWIDREHPRIVVNAAAYAHVDRAESEIELARAVNDTAVGELARACRDAGVFGVHISTDYVFGGPPLGRPWRVTDPVEAHGAYAETKLAGEARFREVLGDDGGLVVRTQWLFGHSGRNFIEAILAQLAPEATLRVVDDQRGRPSWTRDVASGIAWLVAADARGVVHVANEGEATWYDVAARIVEREGTPGVRLERLRTADTGRPAPRPAYSVLDLDDFASRTGRRLPPWTDAVDAYLRMRVARGDAPTDSARIAEPAP